MKGKLVTVLISMLLISCSFFILNIDTESDNNHINNMNNIYKSDDLKENELSDHPWSCFAANERNTGQNEYDASGNSGEILWENRLGGSIQSQPVVGSNGIIYASVGNGHLFAINPNGSTMWKKDLGTNIRTTPAIDSQGNIFVVVNSIPPKGILFSIDRDGNKNWDHILGEGYMFSNPKIDDSGTIYIGSGSGTLYAISSDGKEKWSFKTGDSRLFTPAIYNQTIYVTSEEGYIYAIKRDGTLKNRYHISPTSFPPAIDHNGNIYITAGNKLYAYALEKDLTIKWKYNSGVNLLSSPSIVSDHRLYVRNVNGIISSLSKEGDLIWEEDIGRIISSEPLSISKDGYIFTGNLNGTCYSITPNGEINWKIDLGSQIETSPAIDKDGTIYLGTKDSYMHSIGGKDEGKTEPIPDIGFIDFILIISTAALIYFTYIKMENKWYR